MAFRRRVEVSTGDLRIRDTVLMRNDEPWVVVSIAQDDSVKIQNGTRTATGKRKTWTVLRTVDTSNHLTVQEYLVGCGIEPERLEAAAKTFGTVLAAQFRERHGKDAKPAKKLEYVAYLDTLGGVGEHAEGIARERATGWYEGNAYAPADLDLMDATRAARLPSLGPYKSPEARAIEVLEQFQVSPAELTGKMGRDLLWLAEEQMKRCAASGQVCGHEACSRRRGARWRGPTTARPESMFE